MQNSDLRRGKTLLHISLLFNPLNLLRKVVSHQTNPGEKGQESPNQESGLIVKRINLLLVPSPHFVIYAAQTFLGGSDSNAVGTNGLKESQGHRVQIRICAQQA